jgi:regulator of sirC expression with transglutaminase-like and TPR domain
MEEPDVLEGAIRIARAEYPDVDAAAVRARLEGFARDARAGAPAWDRGDVPRLNHYVFGTLGFRGNDADYYDPRNSYINDVIDRRTGIPITLSVVYCEIGRRLGLPLHGVGFPGHFLVKCVLPGSEVIVDCFHGRTLSKDDCRDLLETVQPGPEKVPLDDSMLAVASPREILSRMLNNLRRIHAGMKDSARALRWAEMELELNPGKPQGYRERGMIHIQMEQFGRALADLERYVRMDPGAPDLPALRDQIQLLRKLISHLN